MMTYALGVDLGTTYSAAAVARGGRVEVCTLGTTAPVIPSVVVLRADGEVLVGEAADRRSVTEPTRTAREFKRRLGDPTPMVLGGTPYGAESLMAQLLKAIVAQVSEREGEAPERIVLTHPANYGPYKIGLLHEAARVAGLDLERVRYVTEPEAAAVSYARAQRVELGELVAVYDFGGGTFDAAMVRRAEHGFELVGTPEGMERLGGIDVDAAVLAHVNTSVDGMLSELDGSDPAVRSALSRLRDECRSAKEALSTDTDTTVPVAVPGLQTEVRLTRAELEDMIRPRVVETVDALGRVVASAGVSMDDVSRVLLVGGTSRIPLVAQLVRELTGRPVAVDAHPKLAIASGAALLGGIEDDAGAAAAAPAGAPAAGAAPVAAAAAGVAAAGLPRPSPRRRRRRVVPIVIGGLVGVGAGVAAVVVLTGGGDDSSSATTVTATAAPDATAASSAPVGETTVPSGATTVPGATTAPPVSAPVRGTIALVAGSGASGTDGEDGPATAAAMSRPENVAVTSTGDVYIADNDTQRILKVSGGTLTSVYVGDPGAGESNTFGVAVAPDDSVWFANGAGVQKLTATGATPVLTREFLLGGQFGLGFDRTGNLYVVESGGYRLLKLDLTGALSVIAGTGDASPQEGGVGDGGPATEAELGQPVAVAIDGDGNVYVAESFTRRIRRITPDGTITTFAGGGTVDVTTAPDGTAATDVLFSTVAGVTVDANGRVYVSDLQGRLIVRFDPDGGLERVAGGGTVDVDAGAPPTETLLGGPKGLGFDQLGTLYFVDGQQVRRIEGAV
ncbi:MAG: Hsp70 family protein [Acidimicrobiales bacterium]|nr:Hsp70 family protein [Acidimicrobiales bacterium]